MRRWFAIAKATTLEILSEPLSLLLLLSALTLAVLAPALHYHQFGESTRMAREAGLSSLFTFGTVFAVAGIFRSFRRELETGTAQMAMSHSVSRGIFFVAKFSGALAAYAVFAVILANVSFVMVCGAAVGGEIARRSGDIARLWAPALAAGLAVVVLAPAVAAALNRFWRVRFVLSAFAAAFLISSAGMAWFMDFPLAARLSGAWLVLAFPAAFHIAAASAFAVGMRQSFAVAATALTMTLSSCAVGNYYLADFLSKGGVVPWMYVAEALLASLPAVAAFVVLGVHLFERRDIA